jgi:hypothetical protein
MSRAVNGEAKQLKSSACLDFRSSMTEAVISKVLTDRYCGIIEIRANTTSTLVKLISITQQYVLLPINVNEMGYHGVHFYIFYNVCIGLRMA